MTLPTSKWHKKNCCQSSTLIVLFVINCPWIKTALGNFTIPICTRHIAIQISFTCLRLLRCLEQSSLSIIQTVWNKPKIALDRKFVGMLMRILLQIITSYHEKTSQLWKIESSIKTTLKVKKSKPLIFFLSISTDEIEIERGKPWPEGIGGVLRNSHGVVLAMFSKHVGIIESNKPRWQWFWRRFRSFPHLFMSNWSWRVTPWMPSLRCPLILRFLGVLNFILMRSSTYRHWFQLSFSMWGGWLMTLGTLWLNKG